MPSHMICETLPDGSEQEYSVEFRITSAGSSASWDHPGDPIEIEIETVLTVPQDKVHKPTDEQYERWTKLIYDEFDFNDWFQGEADTAAEAEYDAWRDERNERDDRT